MKDPKVKRAINKKTIKFENVQNNSSHDDEAQDGPTSGGHSSSEDMGRQERSLSQSGMLSRTNWQATTNVPYVIGAHVTNNNKGIFDQILLGLSWLIMLIFFPFSLFITLKVVQEYE